MLALLLLTAAGVASVVLLFLSLRRAAPIVESTPPPPDRRPRIPPPEFRKMVIDLLSRLGLDIVEEELHGSARRLVAVREGKPEAGRCVVFVESTPPGDLQPLMTELAESVRGESGSVGLLVTPCQVEKAPAPSLDVAVELLDGPRLRQLVAAYLPERLAELDLYRGFSAAAV